MKKLEEEVLSKLTDLISLRMTTKNRHNAMIKLICDYNGNKHKETLYPASRGSSNN